MLSRENPQLLVLRTALMGVLYTAISRKVVAKTVHATIPKGNMDMINTLVPDTVAVEFTFVAFL